MKITKLSLVPFYLATAKVSAIFAIETEPGGGGTGSSSSEYLPDAPSTTVPQIIKTLLDFATVFAVVVCVAILIFAGYNYMTANGDENKISSATKSITWAIIGLVVAFAARILIAFVTDKIFGTGVVPV